MKKRFLRIFSVMLAACLLLASAPLAGLPFAPRARAYEVGDTVEYGTYPQSLVTDEELILQLENAQKTWTSYLYYRGSGSAYNGGMRRYDYMKYADFFFGGEKYRAVYLSSYRPSFTGGYGSADDSYQDENGYTPGITYYFLYEPITWRVLDPAEGLVVSQYAVDSQAFQDMLYGSPSSYTDNVWGNAEYTVLANDYANSTIRTWLTDTFYNTAFTNEQKQNLRADVLLDVHNTAASNASAQAQSYEYASVTDSVFLLSYAESVSEAYGFSTQASRYVQGTDYAKCQGFERLYNGTNGTVSLRSPGSYPRNMYEVDQDGDVRGFDHAVCETCIGVRPACRLAVLQNNAAVAPSLMSEEPVGCCGEDLVWKLDAEGTLTVTGSGEMYDQPFDYSLRKKIKKVIIEEGVTGIGRSAFEDCTSLTSVSLPQSLTSIGTSAFSNCSALPSVDLPQGLRYINGNAFSSCAGLTEIEFPAGLYYIGSNAFSHCSGITAVELPNAITTLPENVFAYCSSLASVRLPSNLKEISAGAFGCCESLREIALPPSLISIGDSAFADSGLTAVEIPQNVSAIGVSAFGECEHLVSVVLPDALQEIPSSAFIECAALSSVVLPAELTTIGDGAFMGCSALTVLAFPETLTTIGVYAFTECISLETLSLPAGVAEIGELAFAACPALRSITVDENNTVFHSENNCLIKTDEKLLVQGCNASVIPADGSVTAIGYAALALCSEFTSLQLPEQITAIGDYAFGSCTALSSVTLPAGLNSIGDSAFDACSALTAVEIPAGVTQITGNPFTECAALSSITVAPGNAVYHAEGNCLIETASETLVSGCCTSVIPANGTVEHIGSRAFFCSRTLSAITIPAGVADIGEEAFSYCGSLTSVTLPQGLTSLGNNAFSYCTVLPAITVPGSVTEIGWGAIPQYTMIYGSAGSYAESWAADNFCAFTDLGEAFVTVFAPAAVDTPAAAVWGNTNPGGTVVCKVNGAVVQTVTAAASGKWNALLPLENAAAGESYAITAQTALNGQTASAAAQVVYTPDAVLFNALTLAHSCYSVTVDARDMGRVNRSINYIPGLPLSFRVEVTNSARVGSLYIVSTKNGESKRMELGYSAEEDAWFANGFFENTDVNYVPGVLTLQGEDKNGAALEIGEELRFTFLIDPSGYAYEAVQSNVLEGVTAAVYYRDAEGHELLWNAEPAEQINPQRTLANGAFAWDVPEGVWQVRLYKENYETAASEWLDVPPARTNLYIPMVSTLAPAVSELNICETHADILFSQYMQISSVTAETVCFGEYSGTFTPLEAAESAPGSGVYYAKAFRFTPAAAFAGTVTASVSGVLNYAGRAMDAPYIVRKTVSAAPGNLTVPESITLACGETAQIEVTAQNAAGATVTAAAGAVFVSVEPHAAVLDENGRAVFTVTGAMPGEAQITFTLPGASLTVQTLAAVSAPVHTHVWEEAETVLAPTCRDAGEILYTCACGETKRGTVPPDPDAHVFRVTVTAPTCTEKGYTTHACTLCRYSYADSETAALGHAYTERYVPASCTAGGYTACTCTRCYDTYHKDATAPLPHTDSNSDGLCDTCGTALNAQQESNCVCGEYHTGPFAGVVRFFHRIVNFFKNLFGRN